MSESTEAAATDVMDEAAVITDAPVTSESASRFEVHLDEFDGPFDLLLSLIAKHRLEVTTLALSEVTDDFIGYIRGQGPQWDLDEATEFLVVAATLLDLKAARLLPSGEVEDEEDIALLEARDLLFARLLQYRAYKQIAAIFSDKFAHAAKRIPRTVGLEPEQAALLPEVLLGLGAAEFALLAQRVLTPKDEPQVGLTHLHVPKVSVREQAAIIVERLRRSRVTTFRALVSDADTTLVVVGRFLALLELFREGVVVFDQAIALGELTIRWTGTESGSVDVHDEFDGPGESLEGDDDAGDVESSVAVGELASASESADVNDGNEEESR